MPTFTNRLRAACDATQSLVCVGLDVNPEAMPIADVADFNRAIVNATSDLVCAYKPNLAFYEALGLPGLRALEATVTHIRQAAPHSIIIGDCKRGDIGSTATAYAAAMFNVWGFDAVTINPWGGLDTVAPWLADPERGAFVWCRGSNPGAADLQDLTVSRRRPAGRTRLSAVGAPVQRAGGQGKPRPGSGRHCPRTAGGGAGGLPRCPPAHPRRRRAGRRFGRQRAQRRRLRRPAGYHQLIPRHHLRILRRGLRRRRPPCRRQLTQRHQRDAGRGRFGMALDLKPDDLKPGDIVRLKKPHPCGGYLCG